MNVRLLHRGQVIEANTSARALPWFWRVKKSDSSHFWAAVRKHNVTNILEHMNSAVEGLLFFRDGTVVVVYSRHRAMTIARTGIHASDPHKTAELQAKEVQTINTWISNDLGPKSPAWVDDVPAQDSSVLHT